jgi:hypothetical protein
MCAIRKGSKPPNLYHKLLVLNVGNLLLFVQVRN